MALALVGCLSACTASQPNRPQSNVIADMGSCQILRVVDGDTVEITCPPKVPPTNIRLLGYDTPETYRPNCAAEKAKGSAATAALTHILSTRTITGVEMDGTDRYQRPLVRMHIDGSDLAAIMIEGGHAVPYSGGRRIDWCSRLNG